MTPITTGTPVRVLSAEESARRLATLHSSEAGRLLADVHEPYGNLTPLFPGDERRQASLLTNADLTVHPAFSDYNPKVRERRRRRVSE